RRKQRAFVPAQSRGLAGRFSGAASLPQTQVGLGNRDLLLRQDFGSDLLSGVESDSFTKDGCRIAVPPEVHVEIGLTELGKGGAKRTQTGQPRIHITRAACVALRELRAGERQRGIFKG